MPTDRALWQLEGDIRQACENYMGDVVAGPWEVVITTFAAAIRSGQLDLATAAKLQLALEQTQGATAPDQCGTCECPYPGQVHR